MTQEVQAYFNNFSIIDIDIRCSPHRKTALGQRIGKDCGRLPQTWEKIRLKYLWFTLR